MGHNISLGKKGEQMALSYLERQGYQFLTQNYYCKWGEVDLIFYDPYLEEMVFVEVKTRSSNKYGGLYAAIDSNKRDCMARTAIIYLDNKKIDLPYRLDGIFICKGDIEHERNI